MSNFDATIVLTLLAKDLASGQIEKAVGELDKLKTRGGIAGTTLKLAGVAIAGGFGLATKGALEAETAQGKFMAATGASRDEAKAFVSQMDALVGTADTAGASFDDIAAAGTAVAQQFDLTGQKLDDLTSKVLGYSRVTGGDATDATRSLKETLDAFHEPADRAVGLMDQLVAASQKFGIDAGPASLDILDKMGPALQTLGGNLDDGIGLLDLFKQGGIDASGALRGLNTAIKNVPPGTTIDDIITKLGGIQDQGDRAKAAIKIFGTQAGVKLAELIQPGMTSLDDFTISAQDAQGSLEKAAQGMETDADKIRAVGDKILAGAREIGQQFGPALTGLASLTTLLSPFSDKVISLLSGVWGKVVNSAIVQGAVGLAGAAAGAVYSAASAAVEILSEHLKLAWTAVVGEESVLSAAKGAGVAAGGSYLAGLSSLAAGGAVVASGALIGKTVADAATQQLGDPLHTQMWGNIMMRRGQVAGTAGGTATAQALAAALAAHLPDDAREAGVAANLVTLFTNDQALSDAGITAADTVGKTFVRVTASQATVAGRALITSFIDQVKADTAHAADVASNSVFAIGSDMVGTLKSFKDNLGSAMDELTYAINHPLELEKDRAKVEGELTSQKLQQALASKNPEIAAQAQQTQAKLIGMWQQLTGDAWDYGLSTSDNLKRGLNDQYPQIRQDAQGLMSSLERLFGQNFHINVGASLGGINPATGRPWGRATGGHVQANTPYIVHPPELFIPDRSGYVAPVGSSGGSTTSSPLELHVHVHSLVPPTGAQGQELARALTPELVRELRRQRFIS